MALSELAHLQLLAEIDALVARLQHWADAAPRCWPPAETCQALVRRLAGRANALRIRLEAPLVVATLGGTGTGKSALVNALAGAELVATGRQRPTTLRPTLVCRPGLTPEMLGIDPANVEVIERDLPALADLVLLDCPDPDTTEEAGDDPAARKHGGRDQPGPAAANPAALRRAAGDDHAAEISQRPGVRGTGRRGRRASAGLRPNPCRPGSGHPRRLAGGPFTALLTRPDFPGRFAGCAGRSQEGRGERPAFAA